MARPRTPISSFGAIHVVQLGPDRFRARARYRFEDGSLRQVERVGVSAPQAKAALKTAMTKITASAGVDVKRETRLKDLADRFLQSKADRAPRTVDTYRQTIKHLISEQIGDLSVSEATPDRLQRYLDSVRVKNGPGAAKAARAVLSGMMGLAARSDAIRANPVRELSRISRSRGGATAIPLADLPRLLAAVKADDRLRELDQVELILFMAGTGCRVGEACALAWEDIDLEAGTARIHANVVRAKQRGLIRQLHTKTDAGNRTIALPSSLLAMLVARRVRGGPNDLGMVFPTVLGKLRDPRNTSRDWALARDRLGFPGVTTHSFRKTVATALDKAGLSARDIAEYLGHENPSLTQDVYMSRTAGTAAAASAIDDLVRLE